MKIKIRPKAGLKVPHPLSQKFLHPDGEMVIRSSYWIRRIKDGDVEEISQELSPQAESKTKEKKKSNKSVEVES
jgi:hypothetical protein